ncbi:hypothetical protein I350_02743 [Cryptococcus amylolentus CBS 6273]|uniref:Methyltransferase domain-containing protein n=1 Tax=Cryptococcus amylolentus CBS 6273 TaxID=1296118 RepID=A0A1E3K8H1_9TREE|nr:hypothetical protein I350_02743 [Cryptococcus amylolentus CBS 6273]
MAEHEDEAVGELESQLGWTSGHSAGGGYFVQGNRLYNNRTWTYRFPSDSHEVVRMDRQHFVLIRSLPGLYRGPVDVVLKRPGMRRRIVDIGCGTGVWTYEMAEAFPQVECVGIDIMPIHHEHDLPNLTFLCANAPSDLRTFADSSFDVVHLRLMLTATSQYEDIVKEVHRILRPGGLILIHEVHVTFVSAWEGFRPEDLMPAMTRMTVLIREAFRYRGVRLDLFESMADVLSSAGFSPEDTDTYYHYRQGCNNQPDSQFGQEDAENFIAYAFACRLVLLESGVIDEEGFDRLWRQMSLEVRGQSSGVGGPLGGQGVLSAWGYWWALKH